MRAEMEMDSAMLGTGRTTLIGTTGLHGGLTGGSYVERSSVSVIFLDQTPTVVIVHYFNQDIGFMK